MKFVMSYSTCQGKYLLWTVFDDNDDEFIKFKIGEFRICDFLEWTIRFQNVTKDIVFSEENIDLFDEVPTETINHILFVW